MVHLRHSSAPVNDVTTPIPNPLTRLHPEGGLDLPFTVHAGEGVTVIMMQPRALHDAALADPRSYAWIRGRQGRVEVDVARLTTINSACCNWLVNLMTAVRPMTVAVTHANAQVAETLRILRLDVLIALRPDGRAPGQHQRPRPLGGAGDLSALE